MLRNFQLAGIVSQQGRVQVFRIPLLQDLQQTLATEWQNQLDAFMGDIQEVEFNAGYQPEEHECFVLADFALPDWLANETSITAANLGAIHQDDALVTAIKGVVGFAQHNGHEILLFQNFSRSHVIQPGRFLFLQNNTYESTQRPGLTLDNKLSAVYQPRGRRLLFRSFRTVNTFIPLDDFYEEASEQQIREALEHENLAPENVDAVAVGANQWFRKRFAMLRNSGVLEQYTPRQIQGRARGYDVEVHLAGGRIVFPAEKAAAKKLLQFLNEEIFRGPITETLYETNSKREAD